MFPFETDPINTAESDTVIKEERKQSLKLQRCSVADGPAVSYILHEYQIKIQKLRLPKTFVKFPHCQTNIYIFRQICLHLLCIGSADS